MIGLGSNRLTIARRGGMSVTQAGRGGMEWLGSRGPSWATPYSAQATAALQDAFTAEQWATIRDYGFAHPEIVNAINLFAPEDPYIMYSLIPELGKTRWLVGDGASWIDTLIPGNNIYELEIDFMQTAYNPSAEYLGIFGSTTPWSSGDSRTRYIAAWAHKSGSNSILHTRIGKNGGNDYSSCVIGLDRVHTIKVTPSGVYFDGTKIFTPEAMWDVTTTLGLFIYHDGNPVPSTYVKEIFRGNISKCSMKNQNGVLIGYFIPCARSNGHIGMVNTAAGTFHDNERYGEGSFTISETPS